MKYKILRTDGDYDFHNNSTITELPEGAIALTSEEWENRLLRIETNEEILQKAKDAKIAQCKQTAFNLIVAQYSDSKQRNVLMSGDETAVAEMNAFIEPIRVRSNEIESEINDVVIDGEYSDENQEPITALEELENINTNFE